MAFVFRWENNHNGVGDKFVGLITTLCLATEKKTKFLIKLYENFNEYEIYDEFNYNKSDISKKNNLEIINISLHDITRKRLESIDSEENKIYKNNITIFYDLMKSDVSNKLVFFYINTHIDQILYIKDNYNLSLTKKLYGQLFEKIIKVEPNKIICPIPKNSDIIGIHIRTYLLDNYYNGKDVDFTQTEMYPRVVTFINALKKKFSSDTIFYVTSDHKSVCDLFIDTFGTNIINGGFLVTHPIFHTGFEKHETYYTAIKGYFNNNDIISHIINLSHCKQIYTCCAGNIGFVSACIKQDNEFFGFNGSEFYKIDFPFKDNGLIIAF